MLRLTEPVALEAFKQQTPLALVDLIEITHPSIAEPKRFTSHGTAVAVDTLSYEPRAIEITLPDQQPASIPDVRCVLDNTDLALTGIFRQINQHPKPRLIHSVVSPAASAAPVFGPLEYEIDNAHIAEDRVTLRLIYEDTLNEPFPGWRFIPADFPGLF